MGYRSKARTLLVALSEEAVPAITIRGAASRNRPIWMPGRRSTSPPSKKWDTRRSASWLNRLKIRRCRMAAQQQNMAGREITIRIPKATWERVMTLANIKGVSFDEMAKDMFLIGYGQIRRSYSDLEV